MRTWTVFLAILLVAPLVGADHVHADDIQWACGGFSQGHPDYCGIDPVGGGEDVESEGEPEFLPAGNDDWIRDDARILGIVHNGEAKAYPVRMLNHHEIVNDVVGGDALTITFCPLCGSGVSFHRTFEYEGAEVTTAFAASGYLYRTDMVMWDPETNQLWNQVTGQAIGWLDVTEPVVTGHTDTQLPFVPTTISTWGDWKQKHSDALLLQPVRSPHSYPENAYSVTDPDNCQHGFSGKTDCDVDGLHPKEQIIGFDDGDGGIAFPLRLVGANDGTATYTTNEGRTFAVQGDLQQGGTMTDVATGDVVASSQMFWFAWADHHPETEVWLPEGTIGGPGGGGQSTPTLPIIGLAIALLAAAMILRSTRKQL